MKRVFGLCLVLLGAPKAPALPPADYFEPDLTMYSFADLWVIRPLSAAVLPLTATTFVLGAPLTAGSGRDAVQGSYDTLVEDPAKFLAARPLGSFFDWENRNKNRPVLIRFSQGYETVQLSPQQERRYRIALKVHEEQMQAIERETSLSEEKRRALVAAEERRWENVLRLLLSL